CSHDLHVGEAIAEGLIWFNDCLARGMAGKDRITAGRDVDLQVSAFCCEESVGLVAPHQRLACAVGDVDEPRLLVLDVTGVGNGGDPYVKFCCTHVARSSPG